MRPFLGMFSLVILTGFAGHDDPQEQTDIFPTSCLFQMLFWHSLHDATGSSGGIQESKVKPSFDVIKGRLFGWMEGTPEADLVGLQGHAATCQTHALLGVSQRVVAGGSWTFSDKTGMRIE